MATGEDETTDRHDESDRAQFDDDPHNIEGTPFEAANCAGCGRYCVKIPGHTIPRCSECARKYAIDLINHLLQTDPANIRFVGTNHTTKYLQNHERRGYVLGPPTTPEKLSGVMWGCIYCLQRGNADNPTHAAALHRIHLAHACPGKPGLSRNETLLRLARRKPLEHLYPETTPPWTPPSPTTPGEPHPPATSPPPTAATDNPD